MIDVNTKEAGSWEPDLASTPAVAPAGLRIVRQLLEELHESGITYCHWKSNEHVGPAVEGLTDLDVLVDAGRAGELQRVLAETGFRRFVAPPLKCYPAIEDYLAFDQDSGRLVHLHLHYELTLGERHLKGYRLPWESQLLETRRFDPDYGIFVADPALEMILLLVRRALKQRSRDRLRGLRTADRGRPKSDFQREFEFLRERTDDEAVVAMGRRLLGPGPSGPLLRLLPEPNSPRNQRAFAAAVRGALRQHRTYGRMEAALRCWVREAHWLADGLNRRHCHRATPRRRISPRGGTIVVLLGSDGAGKSTLSKTLVGWLGAKLDVIPIYFGSGDGPGSFYRWPLRLAHRLFRPALGRDAPAFSEPRGCPPSPSPRPFKSWLRAAARVPWALALSCEKRGKLRRMLRARNRGMIVICDRFPQAEIPGFNDGPLLAHWGRHPWRVCRWLAEWEAQPHAAAQAYPDLVIRLIAAPHVARQRRPEMSLEALARRVQAVQSMRFPATTRVVEINTNKPLDEIARAAKAQIWDLL
jgi:thymidylate kinase